MLAYGFRLEALKMALIVNNNECIEKAFHIFAKAAVSFFIFISYFSHFIMFEILHHKSIFAKYSLVTLLIDLQLVSLQTLENM